MLRLPRVTQFSVRHTGHAWGRVTPTTPSRDASPLALITDGPGSTRRTRSRRRRRTISTPVRLSMPLSSCAIAHYSPPRSRNRHLIADLLLTLAWFSARSRICIHPMMSAEHSRCRAQSQNSPSRSRRRLTQSTRFKSRPSQLELRSTTLSKCIVLEAYHARRQWRGSWRQTYFAASAIPNSADRTGSLSRVVGLFWT
jgi:hypothetical protein